MSACRWWAFRWASSTFSRAERRKPGEKTLRQSKLMRADGVQTGVRKEAERGVEPGDAGEVHRPGLEAVGQEVRHEFGMAEAAGAARDADNDGFHVHSSLYIQFDLAPRRLIRAVFDAGHVEHAAAGDAGMGVVVFVR